MYLIVWIHNSHFTNKVFLHHLASCNNVSLCSVSGVQPLHFGGWQFSWNFIRWRHRSYSTVLQLFRKPLQTKFSSQHFRKWEFFSFNQDADRTMRREQN